MYYLIFIGFAILGWAVSNRLKNKFQTYSEMDLRSGLSGKEIAEKMLNDNGIFDVKVISVEGQLTDHYNPVNKTVNLSFDVYHGRHAAAAAVAAHECGHAVQHAYGYQWLTMRSKLVPAVQLASSIMPWIFMLAIFGLSRFPMLGPIVIALQAVITLFTLVTLPVEFDASKRALAWIDEKMIFTSKEHTASKDALKWAAMTYVVAALAAVTQLLYLILQMNRRD